MADVKTSVVGFEFGPPPNLHTNAGLTRFIYVIRCLEFAKIGVASDLLRRFNEIQCCNPIPLRLEGSRKVPACYAIAIEQEAHARLREFHEQGEWFRVDKSTALSVINPLVQKAFTTERRWIAETGRETAAPRSRESREAGIAQLRALRDNIDASLAKAEQ